MVEQSTAASHALAQETERLAELAGRFHLGAGASVADSARQAPREWALPAPSVNSGVARQLVTEAAFERQAV
jgi:hypothetical protein